MATTKFYLDTRSVNKNKKYTLKLAITKNGETGLLHLNVQLLSTQWDKKTEKIINHPNKLFLNTYITSRKLEVDTIILKLIDSGIIRNMRAKDIKDYIKGELLPVKNDKLDDKLFAKRFEQFMYSKKSSTQQIYLHTYHRLQAFVPDLETLTFEDITKDFLTSFETFLSKTSPSKNARNIHLRNIRAVFNDAIDDEITTFYPFRRFKIRPVATAKRSMSVEDLRTLFNFPVEDHQVKYLEMFKLIFYLIGINIIDLCNLNEIKDGRIEYYRSKTNRLYSLKVEPEAMEIIDKYKGENYLLDIMDRYINHKDYLKRLNQNMRLVGPVTFEETIIKGKKRIIKVHHPLFPKITTYWLRHTWATIAAYLEIPKETIAAALGHGGNTVTDIYINFDQKKIDDANRKVLDFVFNKVKEPD